MKLYRLYTSLLLLFTTIFSCWSERYTIVKLVPSKTEIKIGHKICRVGDEFDDSDTIFWNNSDTLIMNVLCNDKNCYKIENFKVSGIAYPEYGICVYIDKETGLIVRVEEGTRDTDGKIYTQVSDYKYEFNTVTDENLKEPDISQFKVQQ